jgi:hypothetical protein
MKDNEKYWETFKSNGEKLAEVLGYGEVKSFEDLYHNGTVNVFGDPMASAPTLTIYTNKDGKVIRIDINTKYFESSVAATMLNDKVFGETGTPMTFDECIEFVENI